MSLLTFMASVTQTATANVNTNPKTITFVLSLFFIRYPVCLKTMQKYGCLRTQTRFLMKKYEKKRFR